MVIFPGNSHLYLLFRLICGTKSDSFDTIIKIFYQIIIYFMILFFLNIENVLLKTASIGTSIRFFFRSMIIL